MVNMKEFIINDIVINTENNKIGYIKYIFNNNYLSCFNNLYGIIYFNDDKYEIVESIYLKHFINKKEIP